MAVSRALIREAVSRLSAVPGIMMPQANLNEDVMLLARAYPHEDDFEAAIEATEWALRQAVAVRLTPSALRDDLAGWCSYHYQLRRQQGTDADLRLVYQPTERGIRVKGFGHRYWPASLYHRVARKR